MPERTNSSITVAAAPAGVMTVIADFPSYPRWADGITATEVVDAGESGEAGGSGRAERVRFTLDAGIIADSYVLAYVWDGDAGVEWKLAEKGKIVTGMTGAYRLTGDETRTTVVYELAVEVGIPMPGLLRRQAEKRIISAALKGLKARVETRGQSGS